MPYYNYQCQDCNEEMEVKATISEKERGLQLKCSKCNSANMYQVFNPVAVLTSGSPGKSAPPAPSCAGGSCSTCQF